MKDSSIADLVKNNLCTGCGVCTTESNGALRMKWSDQGFLEPEVINEEVPRETLSVCPFNPEPEEATRDEDRLAEVFLKDSSNWDEKIGNFENTFVGYSRSYRETSSSGGVATYIFEQLLIKKVVDHLFIVKEVNGNYAYQLFHKVEDILAISKTRYIPVTMETLFHEIDQIEGKIAISGVACFVKAIRLKQYYHPELKEKIPFIVGIICGGWKSSFFTDFLSQSAGISGDYQKQEYRLKDPESTSSDYSFGAFDRLDLFHQVKMSKLGDMWGTGLFKSRACDFCTDVLTELADISLGDAWLPQYKPDGMGTSVIITRTAIAEELISEGISKGLLIASPTDKEEIIKSQRASFSHRRDAISFRVKLARLKGLPIPYIRPRIYKPISVSYMLVQVFRDRVRNKSLLYWRATQDIKKFNKRMKSELLILKIFTKIYHKLR